MRKLAMIFLLSLGLNSAFGQIKYENQWKKVNAQMEEGEWKSLLPQLKKIRESAQKEKNYTNYLKALQYYETIFYVTQEVEETRKWSVLYMEDLIEEESNAKGIIKNWLEYYNAQALYQYYFNYNYFIGLNTSSEDPNIPLEEWSDTRFQSEINQRFDALYQSQKTLVKEKITDWPLQFESYENVSLTPTLFHYFMQDYFTFLSQKNWNISDEQNIKNKQKQLEVFDALKKVNAQQKWYDSYAYFEAQRTNELDPESQEIFYKKLLQNKWIQKSEYQAQIIYDFVESSTQTHLEKYNFIIQSLQKLDSKNPYVAGLEHLKLEFENKNGQINLPLVWYPRKEMPIKVTHYETEKLYYRIYDVSRAPKKIEFQDSLNAQLQFITNAPLVLEKEIPVQEFHDFNYHSTIWTLEGLPKGEYQWVLSNQKEFQVQDTLKDFIKTQKFLITPYTLNYKIHRQRETNNNTIKTYKVQLLDSETGLPIAHTPIKIYDEIETEKILKRTETDALGYFEFAFNENKSYSDIDEIALLVGNDTHLLFLFDYFDVDYYGGYYNDTEKTKWKDYANVFTDRSIYRPGQKVYFKALLFETLKNERKVLSNKTLEIVFKDPNYQVVNSLELKTNDLGSVAGEFEIPTQGMLGSYHLHIQYKDKTLSRKYLSVEEYKRPKFELEFEKIKEAFTLEDSIQVRGFATSFAGSNITGAEVRYEVRRREIYPFPIWKHGRCYPPPYYSYDDEIIEMGETVTDENGKFEVSFFPEIPESTDSPKDYPKTYSYTIKVDVTDINGETHSASSNARVGTLPKELSIAMPELITNNHIEDVHIGSHNLNGEKVDAQGNYEIIQLVDPHKEVITKYFNYWGEYSLLSDQILQEKFPHYDFKNIQNYSEYELGKTVYSSRFTNSNENTPPSDWGKHRFPKLEPGYYVIQASEMYKNDTIRAFQYFRVKDEKTHKIHNHNFLLARLDAQHYKVGDTARLHFESDLGEGTIYYTIHYEKNNSEPEILTLENGKATLEIPIYKSMLEGLYVDYYFVQKQGIESNTISISIEKEVLPLDISTKVFRDKIRPGEQEKWQIHISGKDKEKITAELLATMYDASLDKIKNHSLNFNIPYYRFYYYNNWNFFSNSIYDLNTYYTSQIPNYYPSTALSKAIEYPYSVFRGSNFKSNGGRLALKSSDSVMIEDMLNAGEEVSDELIKEVIGNDFAPPNAKVVQTLQGEVAGLNITSSSGTPGSSDSISIRGISSLQGSEYPPLYILNGKPITYEEFQQLNQSSITDMKVLKDSVATSLYGSRGAHGVILISTEEGGLPPLPPTGDIQIRKNLEETAFFFPQLRTDENGDILLEFTSPEALTEWKLMLLAHTKDLRTAQQILYTRTQKELMVIPNPPRFLREGDELQFSTKIANISDQKLNGICSLQWFNATDMSPIDIEFGNTQNTQNFEVDAQGNTVVNWQIKVPQDFPAVVYRVIAKTDTFSDGEENSLPILSNRMLVTETQPIWLREGQSQTYSFDSMKTPSATLEPYKMSLDINANPVGMALFSLPYLMEYPYECSEQLFNRWYANSIAQTLMQEQPQLQALMNAFAESDTSISPLLQNETLKNITLEETPWLKDALSDEEKFKELAQHFQSGVLVKNLKKSEKQFWDQQLANGGFSWFKGGKASPYISMYLLASLGKLQKVNPSILEDHQNNIQQLINYIDSYAVEQLKKAEKAKKPYTPDMFSYLYSRSFWLENTPLESYLKQKKNKILEVSMDTFTFNNLQQQAEQAVVLNRYGKKKLAKTILKKFQETSVESDANGVYWRSNTSGYSWYQKPIETQSKIIEAFQEIAPEQIDLIEGMKVWLIGEKKNQHWATTKSTSEAIYVLLHSGKNWEYQPENLKIDSSFEIPSNALTENGFIQSQIDEQDLNPQASEVRIENKNSGVVMGGLYYQYFENLEAIESHHSGLKIEKELYLKSINQEEETLVKITPENPIQVGDKVVVKIIISSDKDVEFIHLKDMRASGFEPGNIISRYHYQNGMGYFINNRDAATHFFFDYLQKGTHVLEYEVVANNAGIFSNGISTIQSMYAPELNAHSNGLQVVIQR